MQYRALIKKSEGWWIGWLVDIPGINAQEKTRKKLLVSLTVCTEEMLTTEVELKETEELVKIEIPV
jgi:predicted RNase H-like HicB family nuclease